MNTYFTCAKQYKLTYVTPVIPYQETEATIWGTEVHLALEEYCRDGKPLDEKYEPYKPYADKLLAQPGDKFFEKEMALDASLKPVGFNDESAVLRGIIDVLMVNGDKALVNDWKTGKVREDSDQLKLFALFVLQTFPNVKKVKTVYTWLKFGKTTTAVYTREDLPDIVQHFITKLNRIRTSYEQDKWLPKTSGLCNGWCGAEGHCEFWRPKRANR